MMSGFKITPEHEKTIPWRLVFIFFLFSAAIIMLGSYYYKSQRNRIFREEEKNLSAVATLKIKQITEWHKERLGDATVIRDNEPLINRIKQFFVDENQPGIKHELTKWMEAVNSGFDYSGVTLIDTLLKIRLAVSPLESFTGEAMGEELSEVFRTQKILMTDLHRAANFRKVHIDILIPLKDPESKDRKLFGVIVLRIDPEKVLFPLIQSWPTPSKSAETLVVRKEGDSVLYLNELRHKQNTSLNLKVSLSNENLPASKAILGFEGVVEGVDYRKIPVVAYLTRIPGFQWFMVAKVDKEELQAPMKRYFFISVTAILLLILINASVFGIWIWDQRVRLYKRQLKNELEKKALMRHFEYLFRYANDIITLTDNDFKIVEANDKALNAYGYTREEMIGMDSGLLRAPLAAQHFLEQMKILDDTISAFYETVHITKAGSEFPVEISARVIEIEGIKYYQSIGRIITDRKHVETALRESEERFRSLYENISIGIYRTTIDGQILMANPSLVRMLGFDSFEQLVQRNLEQEGFEPGYPRSQFLEKMERLGKIEGLESVWYKRDGNPLFVRENANAIKDVHGKILYYDGTVEDISQHKQTENSLRESEELFRKLFENMLNGFAYCKMVYEQGHPKDFIYINVNKSFESLTGLKNVIGKKVSEVIPGIQEADPELIEIYSRVAMTGIPEVFETYIESLKMWFSISVYSPRKEYFVAVFDVITERKLAEVVLRESEDKFKYVFDHSLIGKSLTLPSGEMNVNKAFCDMLGYKPKELKKINWAAISHPEDIELTNEALQLLLSGKKDSTRFIKRYLHKNGSVVWADISTSLRRDDAKKPLYFMTAVNDITERKHAEEEIIKLNEELERRVFQRTEQLEVANKELEAFSYSVSHDLRAPVRSVNGFTKILLEEYENKLDEEGKRICGIISSSAAQMGELIDDLLSFSRIGKSSLNPGLLEMRTMAASVFEEISGEKENGKSILRIDKLHKGFGDARLIRLVWTNLISNAIKYTSKEISPEILIGSEVEGDMITYFVKDNGVGFDTQYKHKLFGVFQRLHSENEFEGNGVGLAIVQRIILKHGGRVWAESEVGKGATFYFSLPIKVKSKK